jgi:predicted type IV restriction endonuclease/GTPase SAR1 family protein
MSELDFTTLYGLKFATDCGGMILQSPFELTEGLARLRAIVSAFPPDSIHWNEAENRFQFVDRLLTECLGWERPNVRVEVTDGAGGRADYILGHPAKAVLEAKREAKSFGNLPTGKSKIVRKIPPLLHASKDFEEAAIQVLQYCALRGAPLAIICNGPQLAIFQALTPGYSPLDGECFFFDGFNAYVEHFSLLWTLLSPEGVTENRASRDLAQHRNPRMPPKGSESIPEPTRFRYRNDFQENLKVLSSLLLEEVEDNPALKSSFYRECYVPLEANNRHLLLSKNIISARYKRVGEDGIAPSAFDEVAKAGPEGDLVLDDAALQGRAGSRPIVVIGDVGVGKTSFFENLYEKLDQSEKGNTYFLHVNLGIKANLSTDIKTYVLGAIPATLKRDYNIDIDSDEFAKTIYHSQLKDFDRSVKGALRRIDPNEYERERIAFLSGLVARRDTHLHAALGHLSRGRNKQILLIMDNADQRSFEVQQEAFLIAQELAATRNLLVFVALRPSTFIQSKMTGALSGYQHKILTISPPPADEVVQRRLTFAVRVAEGKVGPAALSGIRLQLGNVVSFFNATLRSIRTNEAIRFFLSNITGGNTRGVLELITSFFGSPNVDSQKIVRIEQDYGNYQVPLHEFTKHALLGEYAYFNAQSSLVACNIYDVSTADPREHFLSGLLVAYISSNIGIRDNDGFVSGESILEELAKHGFIEDQVRAALRRLAAKRLIETPHSHYRELSVAEGIPPEQFHYRATSSGIYHIRFWTGSFAFLDATATDTPIFDESVRSVVASLAASFSISDRLRRATVFRAYLEAQWQAANIGATYYDFSGLLEIHDDTFNPVRQVVSRNAAAFKQ